MRIKTSLVFAFSILPYRAQAMKPVLWRTAIYRKFFENANFDIAGLLQRIYGI
jgi:hypothetical protein